MPLTLKDPEVARLAREVAQLSGETLTKAIVTALRQRLASLRAQTHGRRLREDLREIGRRCAALPNLDDRSEEEILGYAERTNSSQK